MKKLSFVLLALSLSGCLMQPVPMTPEQIALRQQMLERLTGGQAGISGLTAQQEVPAQKIIETEESLRDRIEAIPQASSPVFLQKKKDGFEVNGKRFIDPEGQIVSYGFDAILGDVTYLARKGGSSFVIKFIRANSGQEPLTIATVEQRGNQYTIETVTGKKLTGDGVIVLSKGFLVSRGNAGFIYEPGSGTSSFAAPDGFHIANFQNGEIQRTGYVLIERDAVDESNTIGGLLSSAKSLGATLGINKKEDYMLFDYKNGQTYPINIDIEGKNVSVHSNCKKKNSFANECKNVDFFESLFDKNGLPNGNHYYWRISWFGTDEGTLLIIKEGTKVIIKQLGSDKEYVAFQRIMGINYMEAARNAEGKILLKAKLGFSTEQIEDLQKFMANADPYSS